jgi:hypothetical protein
MECLLAETRASHEEIMAEIRTNHEKLNTSQEWTIAEDAWLAEMRAW